MYLFAFILTYFVLNGFIRPLHLLEELNDVAFKQYKLSESKTILPNMELDHWEPTFLTREPTLKIPYGLGEMVDAISGTSCTFLEDVSRENIYSYIFLKRFLIHLILMTPVVAWWNNLNCIGTTSRWFLFCDMVEFLAKFEACIHYPKSLSGSLCSDNVLLHILLFIASTWVPVLCVYIIVQ